MNKKFVYVFAIILSVIFSINVEAATYKDYYNASGDSITSSSLVHVDKNIPSEYAGFAIGTDYDSFEGSGRDSSDEYEKHWRENNPNGSTLTGQYSSVAVDSIKGKFSGYYTNVGSYNGKNVDLKITLTDFDVCSSDFCTSNISNQEPFVAFIERDKGIGVSSYKVKYVKLKYEFFESGTTNPIKVKGYTTYWDVDMHQGVHMLSGSNGVYAKTTDSESRLQVTKIDDKDYVFSKDNPGEDYLQRYNPIVSFSETFSGNSFEISYNFLRVNSDNKYRAQGWYWHSATSLLPIKNYSEDTKSGNDNSSVKVDDEIKYHGSFVNYENTEQEVVITDTMSKGLEYIIGSSDIGDPEIVKNNDGSTKLIWKITMDADSSKDIYYSARVTSDALYMVSNVMSVKVGNNTEYSTNTLYNPVPSKDYASDTPSGMDGEEVSINDKIKYSIKYANPYGENTTVIIKDVISKGLKYVKNSSNMGEPKVTKNSNGTTTLIWNLVTKPGNKELTYSVLVVGNGVSEVKNNASIKIGDTSEIKLDELVNPLTPVEEIIDVPDTFSAVGIVSIIAGVALVSGGVYVVYRRYYRHSK